VLYVATASNIVYAFDADDPAANAPLWMKMLEAPVPLVDGYTTCDDMKASGKVGITSTPVIDLAQGKIFVVTKANDATRLHALDLLTGTDAAAATTISAPMFDSRLHLNRPGLLLQDGVIYVAFSSHCDKDPYHGWVFAVDSKTMQSRGVYNTTSGGSRGGIWQSGVGPLGDENGIAFCVGNGAGGMSESVVRIKQMGNTVMLAEHYTPPNAATLTNDDNDLTAGVTRIPGSDLLVSGGKEGPIYLLDAKMVIKQTVNPPEVKSRDGLHSLAAWNGSAGPMVYAWPSGGRLYAYGLAGGQLVLKSMVGLKASHPGGTVTVSSNGTTPNTGIAWATIARTGDSWHGTAIGTLFAYDATDVSKELWNSDDVDANNLGNYAKFSPPVVANGKVYVATFSGKVMVYGLKK
jgi:outer membrane protein assembly factor BamB